MFVGFSVDARPPEFDLLMESVFSGGDVVYLRAGANLSTGGIARDVTDRVHPSVHMMCERAARVLGLDICGIDLIARDIAAPLTSRTPTTGAAAA